MCAQLSSEGLSRNPAIYLDYGADASECDNFRLCEKGMCFKSRWQFTPGTQLAVVLSSNGPDREKQRLDAEATVATCEPVRAGWYEVTALFVDLPVTCRGTLQEIGRQLKSANVEESRPA